MAAGNSKLGYWEPIVLLVLDELVRTKGRNKLRREEIQKYLPKITSTLKKAGYAIGETPENTLDRVIQSLEKQGFLEMCFRRGGERGLYEVNIEKVQEYATSVLSKANK